MTIITLSSIYAEFYSVGPVDKEDRFDGSTTVIGSEFVLDVE